VSAAPALGGAAITIDADHVALDMLGCAIRDDATVAFQHGIAGGRALRDVVVRNGAVPGSMSDGILLDMVQGVALRNLRLLSNGGDGFDLEPGFNVVSRNLAAGGWRVAWYGRFGPCHD